MTGLGGPWGVWSMGLRLRDGESAARAAANLERAGYDALWMTGGIDDPFPRVRELLDATTRVTVATGILSIWTMDAVDVAAQVEALASRDRFVLGLGVSHAALVDREQAGRYGRPLTRMRAYLDALDESGLRADRRILAALGPRMVALAGERSLGAHPYLSTPEHTAWARDVLGEGPMLAPSQMVLLETDPEIARRTARRALSMYLAQPNYVANWERLGFTADDVTDGGSDRLVDAMVAWGDVDAVAARLGAHRDAGADHVCIQMLDASPSAHRLPLPVADLCRLAPALAA